MVNQDNINKAFADFKDKLPFSYCVIDNFLEHSFAEAVANEFPKFDSTNYNGNYDNQIELKKTCNVWDKFPPNTYKLLNYLNSSAFVSKLSMLTSVSDLYADAGLHGGGQHTHPPGGRLNPHLDYNIHPKLGLQRKFNLLIYLTPAWNESWGGHFGLWNSNNNGPTSLNTTVSPLFNRAVFFDTTMNSWHGLATEVKCPIGQSRNSIAVYYLTTLPNDAEPRLRAKFAPTEEQKQDQEILDLIERRSKVNGTKVEDWVRK